MKAKAIALDMDGTLLNEENKVADNVVSLLQHLQQKENIRVFIASGRTRQEIEDVLPDELKPDGIVSANGMGSYIGDETLEEYTINPALVQNTIEEAREKGIYYEAHPLHGERFALKEDRTFFRELLAQPRPDSLMENELHSRREAVDHLIQWTSEPRYQGNVKIYFFSMSVEEIEAWKETLQQKASDDQFSTSSSSMHNVEIMAHGISKATGVSRLLKKYDLAPSQLMAVGDGENDLPMLDLAGHAVAMQNAEHLVKSAVDEVTAYSYKENGLFLFLKDYFEME
ncbi:HAD family hydrolase [Jeotgalibacillus haloalkalitolerans]|uniref:HAD family hydrolase n=1 Tax=Jeotgalibacillus haloalkalitolerans TaxID=3104292 RepID=A0ABU5KHZ9_9BACL|nr:HAD family hydrolase [Jeotgalibacillus sp. HH7-29]MDZ5710774.1 HAD family hydrolase [Jeotgalibacillus sp. HH7-29]